MNPKYLSENETYTATVARIETDKSEDASTTPNHVYNYRRRDFRQDVVSLYFHYRSDDRR